MEQGIRFDRFVRNTCLKMVRDFLIALIFLYLLPLVGVSVEAFGIPKDGDATGRITLFLNVASWIYICIVLVLIIGFHVRSMLSRIKKEMTSVYHKSMWLSPSEKEEPALSLTEFIETRTHIETMQKRIRTMLQTEKEQKEELIFQVSAVSHDIRSPLTVILGNCELLLSTKVDQAQKEYLEDVFHAAGRMNRYFDAFLRYSSTFYEDKADWRSYSAQTAADLIIKETSLSIKGKALLTVETSIANSARLEIQPSYVIRAITNLLNNAAEYAKTQEKKILFRISAEGGYLVFRVKNNASSLSEEALLRCSDLFFRQKGDRNLSEEHYGIGLAFVKRVAILHGGSFSIHNLKDGVEAVLSLKLTS